jgi:hypothetical protein
MLRNWRQRRNLLLGALLLVALFAVTVAAGAAVCQVKTPNGSSLLPFPCCHVTGAIYAGSLATPFEPLTPYFQAPVVIVPALLVCSIFHPPRRLRPRLLHNLRLNLNRMAKNVVSLWSFEGNG